MEYYDRMKLLRLDNYKTQVEIANLLEMSLSTYSQCERGKRTLPIKHLKTLCEYYGVSADYILGLPKGMEWYRRRF